MNSNELGELIKSILSLLNNEKVKQLQTCTIEIPRNPWSKYLDDPRLRSTVINYAIDIGSIGKVNVRVRKLSYSHGVLEIDLGGHSLPLILEYGMKIRIKANPQYIDAGKFMKESISSTVDVKCLELEE